MAKGLRRGDAGTKCLLGIMSRKLFVRPSISDTDGEEKDIAKYFVPGINHPRLRTH